MCRRARTRHPNTVRGVTLPSHAWGIRPITTHWIAGQSKHASLLRMMSFVKIDLNLKPHKHIALHQTPPKLLFFLQRHMTPLNDSKLLIQQFLCIITCISSQKSLLVYAAKYWYFIIIYRIYVIIIYLFRIVILFNMSTYIAMWFNDLSLFI